MNLETSFQIVLEKTFYVPSFRRNLISISYLDKFGYRFNIGNGKVHLVSNSQIIGKFSLSNNLYRLCLSPNNEYLF